jgi:uncharacterized membrane protein HdeD (DUF308 family)
MNETATELKKASGWGMAWGILTILIGLFAIGSPLASGLAVTLVIGIALLAAGFSMLVFAFRAHSLGKILLKLLFAGLTIVAGIAVLSKPGIALAELTLLLGFFFLADGFLGFIVAWNMKPAPGWGWMTVNAFVTFALGIMILKGWPEASLFVVGILVGIRLVFAGITILTMGSVGRQVAKAAGG